VCRFVSNIAGGFDNLWSLAWFVGKSESKNQWRSGWVHFPTKRFRRCTRIVSQKSVSRFPNEALPVADNHFTPGNPFSFRIGLEFTIDPR
jgi:hypothetical protein